MATWKNNTVTALSGWLIDNLSAHVADFVPDKTVFKRYKSPTIVAISRMTKVFAKCEGVATMHEANRHEPEQMTQTCLFENGLRHGTETFLSHGIVHLEIRWKHGIRHGDVIGYFPRHGKQSPVISRNPWVNGIRHGIERRWSSAGLLIAQHRWCNGEPHGLQEAWHRNGTKKYEQWFHHGEMYGQTEWNLRGMAAPPKEHTMTTR